MKQADETAFVEFVQTARPRLRRTAYLLCGDWDLASDHVQEGLIRVYVAWPRMRRTGGARLCQAGGAQRLPRRHPQAIEQGVPHSGRRRGAVG